MHLSSLVHVCAEVPIAKHASQCARVDRRFTIFTATRRDPFIIHIIGCLYTCIWLCIVFIYDYVCLLFCLVTKLPQAWNLPYGKGMVFRLSMFATVRTAENRNRLEKGQRFSTRS